MDIDKKRFINYLRKPHYKFDDELKSLVIVFLYEREFFNQLLNEGDINSSAYYFLKIYEKKLRKIEEEMLTLTERNHLYETLVSEYINTYAKSDADKKHIILKGGTVDNNKKYESEHKDVYINLLCPTDRNKIAIKELNEYVTYDIQGKPHKQRKVIKDKIPFPVYYCDKCQKYYTSVESETDGYKFKVNHTTYINLVPWIHCADYFSTPVAKVRRIKNGYFYVYENSFKKCPSHFCGGKFSEEHVVFKTNNGEKCIKSVRQCKNCGAYFVSISDFENIQMPYNIINESDIPIIRENRAKRLEEEKEQRLLQQEQSRLLKEQKQKEREQARLEEEIKRKEAQQKKEEEKKKKQIALEERKKYEKMSIEELPQIDVRDFVVRRSVFKCMHNDHDIKDILAALKIIDESGNEIKIRVNAGVCPNCKVFFILESTYELIKKRGIPLCRISDEKTYLKNKTINGMRLASESILMQYGYNVNKEENLTPMMRHKILATLIDKHIMRKSEIISYLDFFISQRESQSKYHEAIAKWEIDRKFVEEYKLGRYEQYGVQGLKR